MVVLLLGCSIHAHSQYDTAYVESYRDLLLGRFVVNRKTTGFTFTNSDIGYTLRYQPNKTFNVGVGAAYKFVSFTIGVGFMKPLDTRGETRDYDLQFHSYGQKFVIDFLGQFYKGFHLPDGRFAPPGEEYYLRPDLEVNAIGGSLQYVFNNKQFSYRAAFQQTERQKKPAGTFLIGGELFLGRFDADSSVVPSALAVNGHKETIRKMQFIEIGPNAGYAYIWVYKNVFVTGSATFGLNLGFHKYDDDSGSTSYNGISPNTIFRVSAGYTTRTWGINGMFVTTGLALADFDNRSVSVNSGNVRVNFIYRFTPHKKVKRYLKIIDEVDEKLP